MIKEKIADTRTLSPVFFKDIGLSVKDYLPFPLPFPLPFVAIFHLIKNKD